MKFLLIGLACWFNTDLNNVLNPSEETAQLVEVLQKQIYY